MALTDTLQASLNAGEISRLTLARIDLAKLRMACERQSNWLPHVSGPAMARPGLGYVIGVPGNAEGWLGEFYFDEVSKVLLVATAAGLHFLIDGAWLTRVAVSTTVTNGDFDTDLTGWADSDEAGATSAWDDGKLSLIGTGSNFAYRDQEVTVTDTEIEHALRVVIYRGTVVLQVGSAQGDNDYIDAILLPGTYSLSFTPSGDFWIRLGGNDFFPVFVDSIQVEAAGVVSLPVPWDSKEDFDTIRYDQSGDVIFVASNVQQRRIERRDAVSRSWGVSLYLSDDGPFRAGNTGATTLTPNGVHGAVTLLATHPVFKPGHVGALFKLVHSSQTATAALAGAAQATGAVRVAGLSNTNQGDPTVSSRGVGVSITGAFVGTIDLERSLGDIGAWSVVKSYTDTVAETYDDGLDNQIAYYRLNMSAYTSGSADAELSYAGASQTGIVRITAVNAPDSAAGDVLKQIGAAEATSDWAEGEWSDFRGHPAASALHDGRLSWFPNIKTQLSVSDGFASFDDTVLGDSGPINRTIATGGLDGIRWGLSLQRLLCGTAAQVISIRASAFDEPLTPTAFTARACGTQGAAKLRALRIDTTGVFVERNGKRVYELVFDAQGGDYRAQELTRLKQEMCEAGVVDLAVQRQPDTRVWFVLGDGACAVLTYDQDDEVRAWTPVSSPNGLIERVAVLPGGDEDEVYFIVKRTIGGLTVRYIEKLAKRNECQGGTVCKALIDSHTVYSGAPATRITGLGHLEGQQVVAWADGAPLSTPLAVSGGAVTLPVAASNVVVGLSVLAQLKTSKLAYGAEHGTALTQQKRLARVGLVMADVAWKGVRIGRDFDHMTGLPATYRGKPLTAGQVLPAYDAVPSSFNGGWDADARLCIQVAGPYCATVMGLALQMSTNEPDDAPPAKGRDQG